MEIGKARIYDYVDQATAEHQTKRMHLNGPGSVPELFEEYVAVTDQGRLGFLRDTVESLGATATPDSLLWLPDRFEPEPDADHAHIKPPITQLKGFISHGEHLTRIFKIPTIVTPANETAIKIQDVCSKISPEDVMRNGFRLWLLTRERPAEQHENPVISVGDLEINPIIFSAKNTETNTPLEFSKLEFELISFMANNKGVTLKRQQIMRGVWHKNHDPRDRSVDVIIRKIRHKLSDAGLDDMITTVFGVGYSLNEPGVER